MLHTDKKPSFYHTIFALYLLIYTGINFLFLADFPMLSQWELVMCPVIPFQELTLASLLGSLFYLRLISFFLGLVILILLYTLTLRILSYPFAALLCTALASLNISFINAAHHNIPIMFCLVILLILLLYHTAFFHRLTHGHVILAGFIIGLSAYVSLYFLILFSGFLCLYLFYTFRTGRSVRFIANFLYAFLLTAFAFLLFKTGFSLSLFPEQLFKANPALYTPPYQFFAIVCGFGIFSGLYLVFKERHLPIRYSFTAILYVILGMALCLIFLRRFDPSGILLLMIPAYPLMTYSLINIPKRFISSSIFVVLCISLVVSVTGVLPFAKESYADYSQKIQQFAGTDGNLLAPPNAAFALGDPSRVIFYQGIPVADSPTGLKRFMEKNNIKYIVYPEDIELIHAASPDFDSIYGSMPYYGVLQTFLQSHCQFVGKFESSYGMSISKYYWQKDWWVKVYEIKNDPQ